MFPSDRVQIKNASSIFNGLTGTVVNVEDHEFGTEVYVVLDGRTDDIAFGEWELDNV